MKDKTNEIQRIQSQLEIQNQAERLKAITDCYRYLNELNEKVALDVEGYDRIHKTLQQDFENFSTLDVDIGFLDHGERDSFNFDIKMAKRNLIMKVREVMGEISD